MATLNISDKEVQRLKGLALHVIGGGSARGMKPADQVLVQAILDEYNRGTISLNWLNSEEEDFDNFEDRPIVNISVTTGRWWNGFKWGLITGILFLVFVVLKMKRVI
jgi:hypothetical protein